MAKRRRTVTRSHAADPGYRPGFSRGPTASRNSVPPSRRGVSRLWLALGTIAALAILAVVAYAYFLGPAAGPGASGSPGRSFDGSQLRPPSATPLADAPAEPAGDGTTATIETALGPIVMEIYTESAPVASENFINLAEAGYYDGIVFHRISPGFVVQGGDPNGDGTGGPGYTIPDEPVVGEYVRGTVAMARTPAPNSQGSQFFIVLADGVKDRLPKEGGYVIFGNVLEGMDVVDTIVSRPRQGETALDPAVMESVTIDRPD
jgi:peptidyl-prolyl cis-trans isomerase B (cyclophilin B)